MQRGPRLSLQQVAAAFDAARKVQSGKTRLKDASEALVRDHAFNPSNASITVNVIRYMFSGRTFKMPISLEAVEYCVERITLEEGTIGRHNALVSFLGFIEYIESARENLNGKQTEAIRQRALYASLSAKGVPEDNPVYPDEIEDEKGVMMPEGAVQSVLVNRYERNSKARRKAIAHYGCRCSVCGFDFENCYGNIGRGFIHVHHVIDIAQIGREYQVDPIKDLRPVCPNCHAMLHVSRPAMSIEDLKSRINP